LSIKFILPFSLFFFLSFWQIYAQEYTIDVQRINIEDGLLYRSVKDVIEDNNGLMWLTFDQGLQRYDGYEFKTWTRYDNDKLDFPMYSLGLDDEGWLIWEGSSLLWEQKCGSCPKK